MSRPCFPARYRSCSSTLPVNSIVMQVVYPNPKHPQTRYNPPPMPPTLPLLQGPTLQADTWVWQTRHGDVEVRFTGRGPGGEREEILRRIEPGAPPMAWAKQIHSAVALPARPGFCGEGDALYTEEKGLALSVMTADCVPVLMAGPSEIAAIHAGWRGIVSGIIPATLERLAGPLSEWTAWIGPAIGVCCYEVGEDVAAQVVAAGGPETAVPGPAGKPHLDLPGAARGRPDPRRPRAGHKAPSRPPRRRPPAARESRRGGRERPDPLHALRRGDS